MSQDARTSAFGHLLGLVLIAGLVWLLAFLWSSGPLFLRGTILQDLSVIAYTVAVFGILTLVERIVSALTRH